MDKLNERDIEETYIIRSMDVEALYLSLTIEIVSQMFQESDTKIEGIDYSWELGLYFSLTHKDVELQQKGLKEVCLRHRFDRELRSTITGRGMDETEESRNVSRINNEKEMLTEAIRSVLTCIQVR